MNGKETEREGSSLHYEKKQMLVVLRPCLLARVHITM